MRLLKFQLAYGIIVGLLCVSIFAQNPPPAPDPYIIGNVENMSTVEFEKRRYVCIEAENKYLYFEIFAKPIENVWLSFLTTNLYNKTKCSLIITFDEHSWRSILVGPDKRNYMAIISIEIQKQ